jgi:hypothetical protein
MFVWYMFEACHGSDCAGYTLVMVCYIVRGTSWILGIWFSVWNMSDMEHV